jgi:hypothetical protein
LPLEFHLIFYFLEMTAAIGFNRNRPNGNPANKALALHLH